ncbi:hypothetical protein A3C67_02480 [Candidatus Nomurabacteria bacterium RIFCSPHIGHO2_02_FULL_42_19]|uniref:Response regulatory domain-containing protein n=1 Tax=Candidatus Nomurabacteria bacterium RIFCSPHIGHO2_02_FULL_42_19 TaxID=1801756 RepID=A0A1F6W145_9BACT|nr:MAG: hypothetical protein A3C67_02480 [Candidatus Nomurabacteria bacterium RIFCSPHIGHO2_02_FULL_42_19]
MPYTVLIVEDNPAERERYKVVFESHGFNILQAEDGAKGLAMAIQQKPDIIQTGIIMPNMGGFDMVRELKKNPVTSKIPVIIMSHLGKDEDRTQAQELGIKDFFVAGFVTPNELNKTILLRLEGDKTMKKYLLDINLSVPDAQNLIKDFNFSSNLTCEKHPGEKKVLQLIPEADKMGKFQAKIVCPQETQHGTAR